ncbi:FAD-binding domain-containing protein [Rostrohypoxylon terebratum]|nr:FAD-binding domain-containing protein [Rostrohypoxylon terebratum]
MSVLEAIEAVQKISSELVVLPRTQEYEELTKSYFSELERELKPACFLTPSSPSQVAGILKAIKPFGLQSKVAICGAGQQATPGVANVRDGITIHLKNLRGITIDQGNKIVSVAAGEKMGDVYEAVTDAGLGVVGNRHSSGGIGGDAVQGGLSYFSYSRGFVCDNVVNYEVVLADGKIVNANAKTNNDLWVALKGGGGNFGIVTRFDLSVFEQGQLWGGKVFYFQPSFSGQIISLVEYLHEPKPDTDVHICVSLGYAGAFGDFVCMNDIFSTRPEKPKALEPFADIQPQIEQMRNLRVDSLKNFTSEGFAGALSNRVVKMSTTVKANADILEYSVKAYHAAFDKLKKVTNILFSITFEPIPVSLIDHSIAHGGNSLGLKPKDGPLVVVLFYTSWDNASDDDLVYNVNKEAISTLEEEAQDKNALSSYRYLNYTFPHQDPFTSYGPESKAQLLKTSAKYDPDGFFESAGAGPFKLRK